MNVRLFNDNGCETPNELGNLWQQDITKVLHLLVREALKKNVSLRDLQTLVNEEISLACAEARLRRGLKEHKLQQPLPKNECGCAGVCLPTDGNP